ncbi:MAG: hypothetical protein ACJ8BW_22050 [Ktedonobacteraceae bacterium]
MEEGPLQGLIHKFHAHIDRGNLTDDIKMIYRVQGGLPRIEEEYRLSGSGAATLLRDDPLYSIPRQEFSTTLHQAESRELFQLIRSGLTGLISQPQPPFLVPDSVLGSLMVEVDGEKAAFHFILQDVTGTAQYKPIDEAVERFRAIAQRLQKRE